MTTHSIEGRGGPAGDAAAPRARVLALLAAAAAHYQAALRASPQAVAYLRGRGLGGAGAAHFGLGFADAAWQGLDSVLQPFDEATIQASGLLAAKAEDPRRRFDRFRNRVLFPIRGAQGEVLGFGARVLVDAQATPKYMNSPEGPCFKKRTLLYGLYEAQGAIRAHNTAVVVEGYFDVLTLAQAGFKQVVGTLGTACSADQLALLTGMARHLVFAFDGDAAGRHAAVAALRTVLPYAVDDLQVSFALLPAGHDPDSLVRTHGVEAFHAALSHAVGLNRFIQQHIGEGCDLGLAEGRARCVARARPVWLALPEGRYREELLAYCSTITRLPSQWVAELWLRHS